MLDPQKGSDLPAGQRTVDFITFLRRWRIDLDKASRAWYAGNQIITPYSHDGH
jgi:hypothetical protein